jgi:hypothetical protein
MTRYIIPLILSIAFTLGALYLIGMMDYALGLVK